MGVYPVVAQATTFAAIERYFILSFEAFETVGSTIEMNEVGLARLIWVRRWLTGICC